MTCARSIRYTEWNKKNNELSQPIHLLLFSLLCDIIPLHNNKYKPTVSNAHALVEKTCNLDCYISSLFLQSKTKQIKMTIDIDDATTNKYLTLYINQKKVIEKNAEPHWTLVYYLRTSKDWIVFQTTIFYLKVFEIKNKKSPLNDQPLNLSILSYSFRIKSYWYKSWLWYWRLWYVLNSSNIIVSQNQICFLQVHVQLSSRNMILQQNQLLTLVSIHVWHFCVHWMVVIF
jgi:hypothetical protein